MDTRLFGGDQLNGAFFTLGDAVAIIMLVPFFEKVVWPVASSLRGGRPVTRWAKYTTGFILAILANVAAVLIENMRRGMSEGNDPDFVPCPVEDMGKDHICKVIDGRSFLLSKCSPHAKLPMTNMSALWTLIPMFLTGAGEIMVNPVVYQYVFEHAPSRLRSILQALNLVAAGAISNAITAALGPLIPEDFNKGSLVYYFYANIVLAVLLLVAYWAIAAWGPPAQAAARGSEREVGAVAPEGTCAASGSRPCDSRPSSSAAGHALLSNSDLGSMSNV
jgi:dipeptide/tripeptide permease